MQTIALYATDTMADWEYAYLTASITSAERQRPGRFRLRVLGETEADIRTLGGLAVRVDGTLDELDATSTALLVLPGGDTWGDGHEPVLSHAGRLLDAGVPVAAICGATLGLARAGLLDERAHTSNALEFLAQSGYQGAAHYRDEPVVQDGGVITAPGTRPLEFTAEILRRLEVFPAEVVDAWYGLYSTGERRYYDALVAAAG